MSVTNNGVGFDVQGVKTRISLKGSLGLMSLQEWANLMGAELNIKSGIGQGTTISVEVPLSG